MPRSVKKKKVSPLQTRLLQTGPTWTGGLMSWYLFRNAVSLYWILCRLISYLKWWKTQGGPEIEQKVQLDLPFKMKYSHEWNLFWVTIKKHDFIIALYRSTVMMKAPLNQYFHFLLLWCKVCIFYYARSCSNKCYLIFSFVSKQSRYLW